MATPELTAEELRYYASLDLADPDEDALQSFLQAGAPSPPLHTNIDGTTVARPITAGPSPPSATSSSTSVDAAAPSVTPPALSRRPHSASAMTTYAAVTAAARGVPPHRRVGVTDVLDKTDLVGGVAGMADATLQTRVVELPGRQLTSLATVQCFLNATHLYLQHNDIASLEGLELLPRLQVLVIHHNRLTSVEPLRGLDQLFYVDLSDNKLASLAVLLEVELPCAGLRYVKLSGNPLSEGDTGDDAGHDAYVAAVRAACPALECLDDVQLDGDSDDEESDKATANAAHEAGVAAGQSGAEYRGGSGNSSRRAQNSVEAARAAAAATTQASRGAGDAAVKATAARLSGEESSPVTAAAHGEARPSSDTNPSKVNTPLEQEVERLLRQLLQRASDTRPISAATADSSDALAPVDDTVDGAFVDEGQSDAGDASSGVMDARQIFQSLQYTQEVRQARQQRDLAAHWDDVSRVLQTAQGLQHDRRRRMHERLQSDTPSYAETLQLLQKESYSHNLDRYRTTEAPPPPPTVSGGAAPKPPQPQSAPAASASATAAVTRGVAGQTPTGNTSASKPKKNSVGKRTEASASRVPKPPPSRR